MFTGKIKATKKEEFNTQYIEDGTEDLNQKSSRILLAPTYFYRLINSKNLQPFS